MFGNCCCVTDCPFCEAEGTDIEVDLGLGGWVDGYYSDCDEIAGLYVLTPGFWIPSAPDVVDPVYRFGGAANDPYTGICQFGYATTLPSSIYLQVGLTVTDNGTYWSFFLEVNYFALGLFAGSMYAVFEADVDKDDLICGDPITLTKTLDSGGSIAACTGALPGTATIEKV